MSENKTSEKYEPTSRVRIKLIALEIQLKLSSLKPKEVEVRRDI